jgi:hypothetical protein
MLYQDVNDAQSIESLLLNTEDLNLQQVSACDLALFINMSVCSLKHSDKYSHLPDSVSFWTVKIIIFYMHVLYKKPCFIINHKNKE